MINPTKCGALLMGLVVLGAAAAAHAQTSTPKTFPPPAKTKWKPVGCRGVPATDPVLPSHGVWSNIHGDSIASDGIARAFAPMMHEDWTAEATTYNPTGPVFDSQGNLYFSPFIPYENVVLISLNPTDGSRRWAIAGKSKGSLPGGSAPMVLQDPNAPGTELIYLALYDRAFAVRTDGTIVWDVPTGLTPGRLAASEYLVSGVNYLPTADAIVGLTGDGYMFMLDRETGARLLTTPYQLPGQRSPVVPPSLPESLTTPADVLFRQFVNVPVKSLTRFTSILQGNDVEVSNMFSIDPRTGRLWVAATAPDAEDGTTDGRSSLGALYGLEVTAGPSGYTITEACHRSFEGGSASTPTLNAAGTRIYLGDNFGKLLAISSACQDVWEVDLGLQIFGSVAVADDNAEVYASTQAGIFKVIDTGTQGRVAWTAQLDVYDLVGEQLNLNMNLVAIGANGLAFQAGAGVLLNNVGIASTIGAGVLDRNTGKVRYFSNGGEETVAVMSTGPDGALYIGNSPVRRLFGQVLGVSPAPLRGGITKFVPQRLDLLVRDAACAGQLRAKNANKYKKKCPDSLGADLIQVQDLVDQIQETGPKAVAAANIKATDWIKFEKKLTEAEAALAVGNIKKAGTKLGGICSKIK